MSKDSYRIDLEISYGHSFFPKISVIFGEKGKNEDKEKREEFIQNTKE